MSVITLTTDFGIKDHYVGSVKGALFNELENVNIVDVSHNISPFNIVEAAYIVENSYKNFPEGSIHIIGVDSEKTIEQSHLVIKLDNHFFICANNGIMSLLASKINPEKIIEINIHNDKVTTFSVIDVFVKIAAHIYRGGSIDLVGNQIFKLKELYNLNPILNEKSNEISGNVIYVDNYDNVVTNISKKTFIEFGKSRSFEINARNYIFKEIVSSYGNAIRFDIKKENRKEIGKKIALFNKSNYLELSIYKSNPETFGGAASLFGLNYRDVITIKFN
ncbi:SAM-dependent chlorinase/fluorinase [Flavobacteriaceae bacterium]|jgi:S-adenosylmethionine hydrolase|nr:SAM-dependent chlorinase/fluorinase [Flavobacteriaceae bacterium]MBT5233043.1 SAM-dependent chlorinase/fluorinase [Flavobacteriaceae bacterium]MDA8558989.1 SAM-dependent chlorinase/fluorinase [Flavobacteriaceae bacterium]MDB2384037.1 SAM-dependent chlorinase/fluorinase [Flavobacteriaceae bacterium]MDB2566996.1 SAM-dependent chlorinase/fluorinase [Flavobacteriaceae bacterium]|tara:strand:+ start:1284 stop:2114 length:831 start_codon:yes stop_codon:yes gene_type:complete